jgi:uncharacterized protein (DUF58 family)
MTETALAPQSKTAKASPHGRLAFAMTPRVLVLLVAGLPWLIPAWFSRQWLIGLLLWDAIVLLAWLFDLVRLPAPKNIEVSRLWPQALSLGRISPVELEIHNGSTVPLFAWITDETPTLFSDAPPTQWANLPAGETVKQNYEIQPKSRGDITQGRAFVRYQSSLGLAERWAVADVAQTARVMPDLVRARNAALYLIRAKQVEMEKRRRRQRGAGREFEALREYRPGDEMRTISWSATARRHQLITRTFQVERSQTVWIVVDSGRLLRTLIEDAERGIPVSKVDVAVDAALALAQVAVQSGDRVGLIAYGRTVQKMIAPGRGAQHVRTILDALSQVKVEVNEANHTLAARTLLHAQTQRALIVWITDFAETATVPEIIEHAALMQRKHLVVFAAMAQPDLALVAQQVPDSEASLFRHTAAVEVSDRRQKLLRLLRDQGVLALDMEPHDFSDGLLNQYLEIKDRSWL